MNKIKRIMKREGGTNMMSWVPAWATRRTEVPFKRTGIKSSIRPGVLVSVFSGDRDLCK